MNWKLSDDGKLDEADRSSWMCSLKAPWRARTPTVMAWLPVSSFILDEILMRPQQLRGHRKEK